MDKEMVDRLRAVEALRAGVPNRDAVRQLPPLQEEIERRFQALIEATDAGWMEEQAPGAPGLLLEGDFGTGKSHWLEYFEHVALENNFLCSRIVVNKEQPLHDLAKILRAAAESVVAPGRTGSLLQEIALSYRKERAPGFEELAAWVRRRADLDPRLPLTLFLFAENMDPELRRRILDEWIGDPMRVSDLRAALKAVDPTGTHAVSRPARGQTLLRFEFLSRFFSSAGYAGWVLLLDEAEMISRYSLRQRGRAYAHLAQLLGMVRGQRVPGLACVATITKDYAGQVLYGRKNDIETVPARLQGTNDAPCIPAAEAGMRAIKGRGIDIRPPTRAQLQEVYGRVRELYSRAYGWNAPEITGTREYSSSTGMRQYVRSWINIWDLRRLYDYDADLVVREERIGYDEDPDFQAEPSSEVQEPVITT